MIVLEKKLDIDSVMKSKAVFRAGFTRLPAYVFKEGFSELPKVSSSIFEEGLGKY